MCASSEEKSDYSKEEQVVGQFREHHMKILLVDFNTKVGKEDIFNPTNGNESLNQKIMIIVLE